MTFSHLFRFLTLALLGTGTLVLADIDHSDFPDALKAMEWREVGPYRAGVQPP